VVVNFDIFPAFMQLEKIDVRQMTEAIFEYIDDPGTRMDTVYWCFSEGNEALWPSKVLPFIDAGPYSEWLKTGFDPVRAIMDESRSRGIESFFSYRINGSDNDVPGRQPVLPMKEEHPDWLIHTHNFNGYWNFAVKGVRDYKLNILREIAEEYDYDGIDIDFARVCPVLPPGHQWENREAITDFMRSVRSMLLDVARTRGRPFLLSARVPENLEGCHFDGLDIETWAREELVDIIAIGCRSYDVDVAAFRLASEGTRIKLYPVLDAHHATDGYQHPPIEVLRGVLSNWLQQGADGIQTFNFAHVRSDTLVKYGMSDRYPAWSAHLDFYRELSDMNSVKTSDRVFVVQRRGGGHGPSVIPNPEDWSTPRRAYFNTNMFGQLPMVIDPSPVVDTFVKIYVGGDVATGSDVGIRVLLSDESAAKMPDDSRLDRVVVATIGHSDSALENVPPERGIVEQVEIRLNNLLLGRGTENEGWLVFNVDPRQLATGENLVGIRLVNRDISTDHHVTIEKLEISLRTPA